MYGNYTLYAYDSKFNCTQEWSFENVMIDYSRQGVAVIDRQGKMIYFISTAMCTVIVMEDNARQ